GVEASHDVGRQPGGNDTNTRVAIGDRHLHLNGDVEIGAGQVQLVAGNLEPDTGQRRERGTACGRSSPCCGDRIEERIALSTELHRSRPFMYLEVKERTTGTVGPVNWG